MVNRRDLAWRAKTAQDCMLAVPAAVQPLLVANLGIMGWATGLEKYFTRREVETAEEALKCDPDDPETFYLDGKYWAFDEHLDYDPNHECQTMRPVFYRNLHESDYYLKAPVGGTPCANLAESAFTFQPVADSAGWWNAYVQVPLEDME